LQGYNAVKTFLTKAALEKGGVGNVTTPGTLYFNPECDSLQITAWPHENIHIPHFLHDLKTRYNPQGVGLLNLVVASSKEDTSNDIFHALKPTPATPSAIKQSVQATLGQLHEVFFHQTIATPTTVRDLIALYHSAPQYPLSSA
jgi:hypothetical protein